MQTTSHAPTTLRETPRMPRGGFSLLEVLVASGILVVGLASVAAILPAAGSRLAEATAIDRSGTLAANAYADIVSRRLAAAALFTNVGSGTAVVFGQGVTAVTGTSIALANTTELGTRINRSVDTSFHLEDDLVYAQGATILPVNVFDGSGFRDFKRGVCYGAMLAPEPFGQPVASGSTARLSIAIFKKTQTTAKSLTLARVANASTIFKLTGTTPFTIDADLKRFLRGCSWVLAVSSDATQPPRWFRIASSWTTTITNPTTYAQEPSESFVSIESDDVTSFKPTTGNLTVYGFEGLLRVEERFVPLE